MTRHRLRPIIVAAALSLAGAAHGQVTFEGIGALPGFSHSNPHALSGDGNVIAGICWVVTPPTVQEATFRWTRGVGWEMLEPTGFPEALSHDGTIVVGYYGQGCYWDAAGAVHFPQSVAYTLGVSADGLTIVGSASFPQTVRRAAKWVGGGPPVQLPTGTSGVWISDASAISADGSRIAGTSGKVFGGGFASIWTDNEQIDLARPLGSPGCWGHAISADGFIVAGRCDIQGTAADNVVRWSTPDQPWILFTGTVTGMSADAEVIAGGSAALGGAVIWTRASGPLAIAPLLASFGAPVQGWTLTGAMGISADGRTVTGRGKNPAGIDEGWIATLPEGVGCYANCTFDLTPAGAAILTVADFSCFQTRFVAGDPYADCNDSGSLTIADFACFQTKFAAGCP